MARPAARPGGGVHGRGASRRRPLRGRLLRSEPRVRRGSRAGAGSGVHAAMRGHRETVRRRFHLRFFRFRGVGAGLLSRRSRKGRGGLRKVDQRLRSGPAVQLRARPMRAALLRRPAWLGMPPRAGVPRRLRHRLRHDGRVPGRPALLSLAHGPIWILRPPGIPRRLRLRRRARLRPEHVLHRGRGMRAAALTMAMGLAACAASRSPCSPDGGGPNVCRPYERCVLVRSSGESPETASYEWACLRRCYLPDTLCATGEVCLDFREGPACWWGGEMGEGESCVVSLSCGRGMRCVGRTSPGSVGRCLYACDDTHPCPGGRTCRGGNCVGE